MELTNEELNLLFVLLNSNFPTDGNTAKLRVKVMDKIEAEIKERKKKKEK